MPKPLLAALALACLSACAAVPARAEGPPDSLVRAIVHVESGGNPRVIGAAGEIGLMQLKLETARSVGYRGTKSGLFDPSTNLAVGTAYLAIAWRRAGGDPCAAASLFNMGVFARPRCTTYGRAVLAAMGLASTREGTATYEYRHHRGREGGHRKGIRRPRTHRRGAP